MFNLSLGESITESMKCITPIESFGELSVVCYPWITHVEHVVALIHCVEVT